MTRFHLFGAERARRTIEEAGFRTNVLESPLGQLHDSICLWVRKASDLERVLPLVNELSRQWRVHLIFHDPKVSGDGIVSSPSGAYLTQRETEFLSHLVNNDVVKKSLCAMSISHSGYYKMLNRMLDKLGLEDSAQLRAWALIHLSV